MTNPAYLRRLCFRLVWPFLFISISGLAVALVFEYGLVPQSRWVHPFYLSLILLLTVLGGFVVLLIWVKRRTREGDYYRCLNRALAEAGYPYCLSCGYALTGLSESAVRCPECGSQIERTPKAQQ